MTESRPDLPTVSRRSRRVLWVSVLLCLAAALAVWLYMRLSAPAGHPGGRGGMGRASRAAAATGPGVPAIPVKIATARRQDIPIYLQALGTVVAYNTVTVRSRVDGELVDVGFTEGQQVKAGAFLAQIDSRSFKAQLAQAQGTQQKNQALLANARRDLQRYRTLSKQESIARQQVDTQQALVQQYEGTQKIDQAAVDAATLQLDYARITAPIAGRLGLRKVDRGNLVSTGDADGLVVITQTQPIAVMFTLPETQFPQVLAQLRDGRVLEVDASDRTGARQIVTGTLEAVDNQIDVATGTIKLKARFANADETLFPNQFVNVRLHVQTRQGATAIPTVAAQQGANGTFAFVVQADNTVAIRQIVLGPVYQDMVAVNAGLQPGERVVMEGIDRLRAGAKVDVVSANPPAGATPVATSTLVPAPAPAPAAARPGAAPRAS